jgi:hypothetical protein
MEVAAAALHGFDHIPVPAGYQLEKSEAGRPNAKHALLRVGKRDIFPA